MKTYHLFLYEFKHFSRSKTKVFSFLLFVIASFYALYSGFDLQNKQQKTLANIEQTRQEGITKVLTWYDEGKKGPADRSWIDITTPFWALWHTPTYSIKSPSPLLPLGIGQAEQYGYYKSVTTWSSVYDNDMVEELANPERLVNGNIDFSFLIIFLLPILMIILTYNINGLEKDLNFYKLIVIQSGSTQKWILARLSFYSTILIATVSVLILVVALMNDSLTSEVLALVLLSTLYIIIWTLLFYFIILKSHSSSSIAFKMISFWLIFCVLIPGAVHQLASLKYPANYMTDYLDANRKEAYEIYDLAPDTLSVLLKNIYPDLIKTEHGQDTLADEEIINNTVTAIVNQLNKTAIEKIEKQNEIKNKFIVSSYWYNPISFVQNKWNSLTATDYNAYQDYRNNIQKSIDKKIELLVYECWDKKKVDKETFTQYLKILR